MARQTDGISQALQSATNLSLGAPSKMAVSLWLWWDTFASNDKQALEYSADFAAAGPGCLIDPNHNSGNFQTGVADAVPLISAGTYARPSAAAWHHYLVDFDLALGVNEFIDAYIDGVSQTITYTNNTNPTGTFTDKVLNLMCRNNASNFGAGRIAEVAIWAGVNLTGTDATNLTAGTLPTSIQSGSLKHYWKLCGTSSPEPDSVGGVNMTVNGATFVAHPPAVAGSCGTPITGLGQKHMGFNYARPYL